MSRRPALFLDRDGVINIDHGYVYRRDQFEFYFCPFHPEHGVGDYKRESIFRKPGPGMILEAARDYELDLAGSVLVGVQETDIAAGLAAGVGCNILYCPQGNAQITSSAVVRDNLADIGNCLISQTGQ